MKIEHAVMRLKWMLFGVALLLGCVLFNQVTLLELVWLSLPVALVGFIMVRTCGGSCWTWMRISGLKAS